MRIVIDYHSSWQASFLEGSDQEPLPKNNRREFNASSKLTVKKDISITKNTVVGVLYRLIGDQRKLYQARQDGNSYFNKVVPESSVSFSSLTDNRWDEAVMIINKKESRPPQSNYIGIIRSDTGLFFSEHAATLWAVLFLDMKTLINFINNDEKLGQQVKCNPMKILDRISDISKMDKLETRKSLIESKRIQKAKSEDKLNELRSKLADQKDEKKANKLKRQINQQVEFIASLERELEAIHNDKSLLDYDNVLQQAIKFLKSEFSQEYLERDHKILPIRFYSAALYLQLNRMKDSGIDIKDLLNDRKGIQGFSKRSFNGVRDFLNPFSTSKTAKKTVKTPANITKASGQLEIHLDIDSEKAKELKMMIDDAGVSSFYLGKKGLAYVSRIRL